MPASTQLSCGVDVLVGVPAEVGTAVGLVAVGVAVVVVVLPVGEGTVLRWTGGYELALSGTTVMLVIEAGIVSLLPCVK